MNGWPEIPPGAQGHRRRNGGICSPPSARARHRTDTREMADVIPGVSSTELKREIRNICETGDLHVLTSKTVRSLLEETFDRPLKEHKKGIEAVLLEVLAAIQAKKEGGKATHKPKATPRTAAHDAKSKKPSAVVKKAAARKASKRQSSCSEDESDASDASDESDCSVGKKRKKETSKVTKKPSKEARREADAVREPTAEERRLRDLIRKCGLTARIASATKAAGKPIKEMSESEVRASP